MAGRRRRRNKKQLLSQTTRKKVRASSPDQDAQWTAIELPTELLEVIFSRLNLKENICASAVCKRWLAVASSIRVANKPPLLMFLPKVGNLFDFYDPSSRKSYCLKMPELEGTTLCYSKYGWLLLSQQRTNRIFFFCPYTRESIQLPNFHVTSQVVFSSPPKSPDCIILTIKYINHVAIMICTCRPGASTWTTANYPNHFPFVFSPRNMLSFCKERLYCMSFTGSLCVYDPVTSAWFVHSARPPVQYLPINSWWKCKFLAEHDGNLFVIYTCDSTKVLVYKLDQTRQIWMNVGNLGGLTVFANFLSSHCKMDLLGNMRNNIYFSEVRYSGRRCVTYSLRDERYYPRKHYDWSEDSCDSIWIEPPEDLSVFL